MERPLAALAVFAGALAAAAGIHVVTVCVRRARAGSAHDGGAPSPEPDDASPEHDDGPAGQGRRGRRTIAAR